MIHWIIFSKDRAAQLDLLLRSIEKYVPPASSLRIDVLYTSSSGEYEDGYNMLPQEYKRLLLRETDFKAQLDNIICTTSAEQVGLLCDDDVFIRKFKPKRIPPDCNNRSLRLNPNMKYSYNSQSEQHYGYATYLDKSTFIWYWQNSSYDFGYPWSVSCTLWPTHKLQSALPELSYRNPNTLEDALRNYPVTQPRMTCDTENCMVNIPSNRVQTTHPNPTAGYSARELNEKFLMHHHINLGPLANLESDSCHAPVEYQFL